MRPISIIPFEIFGIHILGKKKKRRILNIHFIWGDFHQSLANDLSQFERWFLDYEFLGLC